MSAALLRPRRVAIVVAVAVTVLGLAPTVPRLVHGAPPSAPEEATTAELRDPASTGTYTVRRGDYLYGIARTTGTPLATLLQLNGLTLGSVIHPGQVLRVAGAGSPSTPAWTGGTFTVRRGDYLYGIARTTGTPVATLLQLNGLTLGSVIHPGQVLKVAGAGPTPTGVTYTVVRGDCWSCIARRLGVPMRDLLAANGATVTTVIHPGQRVAVPAVSTAGGWAGASRPAASDPWLSDRLDDAVGAWRVRLAGTLGGLPVRVVWDDQLVAGADAVAEPTLTIRLHPRLQDRSIRTVLDVLAHEFGHIMVLVGVQNGTLRDPGICHEKVADELASRLRDRTVRVHLTPRCTWDDARAIADSVIAQGF